MHEPIVPCITIYHILHKGLHKRFSKFLSRSKKLSLEVLVNIKTVAVIQEIKKLAQAYSKKVQLSQIQKDKYSPILKAMSQVETLRKQIELLKKTREKYYSSLSTKQYLLNEVLRKNSLVKKHRVCYKVLLLKLFNEYKKYQIKRYTGCWRINSSFIKIFDMKYKLQDIEELKERANIKFLNLIFTTTISYNHFMLLLRTINHEGKKEKLEESLLMLNAICNTKQHRKELKGSINTWRANVLSPRKLIDIQEQKIQLLTVLINLKLKVQVNYSMSFEMIREESKVKRNKVNVNYITKKVRFINIINRT